MLFSVKDLHVKYGKFEAVRGVSFDLNEGEILAIVGESGSGKSTIAKTLIGLERPSSGTIMVGPSLRDRRRAQMIFQDAVGSLNPRMKIGSALQEAISHAGEGTRTLLSATKAMPQELLSLVGLSPAVLDQYPRELSGGQCQRVSIARALACHPVALIADEPVSALDVSVQARILNLLRDLRSRLGLAILLIAHDLAVVKNIADKVCVMEHGRFVDVGPAEQVFNNPQSEYTKKLLSAVPRI